MSRYRVFLTDNNGKCAKCKTTKSDDMLDEILRCLDGNPDLQLHVRQALLRWRDSEVSRVLDNKDEEIEAHYGEHFIPENWDKIDSVYIWFNELKKSGIDWRGIPGYVYKKPDGTYVAPFRGKLVNVIKDTKDEFRQVSDEQTR